jgi:hypothetical protein
MSLDLGHGFRGVIGGQSSGGEKQQEKELAHSAGSVALARRYADEVSDTTSAAAATITSDNLCDRSRLVGKPDISNNVGPV